MNKYLVIVFLSLVFIFSSSESAKAQYEITATVNGLKDTTLILGHYFNKKMYVNDTIFVDKKGVGTFKGDDKLPGGIYLVYLPNQRYFDLLINEEQNFSFSVDTTDFINTLEFKGNKEGELFNKYQRYITSQQQKAEKLRQELKNCTPNGDSAKQFQEQLNKVSNDVKVYWDNIIINNPKSFLASFLKAMKDIEIPEFDIPQNVVNRDSVEHWTKYNYYKEHYFDNINLKDERFLRTPFFVNKVDTYFNKTLFQIPDTLANEAIKIIEKTRGNDEMFRFMLQHLFNFANESKLMGMDAMTVALGEKYYLSGEATWADDEFKEKLKERITKMKPNLIGNIAPDLTLQSYTEEFFRLHEINAPYTIMIFWEPSCGHCKKEVPKLKDDVWEKYKDTGIKIFAVYTQIDKEEWVDFIEENDLSEWMNVYDPYNHSNFRNLYDIYSTPVIYILDKDKKIVAKRLAAENIPGFLDHYLKN